MAGLNHIAITRMKAGDELADSGEYRGLRVTRSQTDHRFWYRVTEPDGKQRAVHIGYGREMSLAEARVAFERLKSQRRAGITPRAAPARPPAPAAPVGAYTVADMVSDYLNALSGRRTPKSVKEAGRIFSHCVTARYGTLAAGELAVEHALDIAQRELNAGHNTQAGNVLRELSGAIEMATLARHLPLDHVDPAAAARKLIRRTGSRLSSNRRQRFLTDAEIAAFVLWLPHSQFSRSQRPALRLALEVGCRTGEAISARWDAFDLDRGLWSLPRTKTDAPRVIRLPRQSIEWLRAQQSVIGGNFLCPSTKGRASIQQKTLTETMWRMRRDGTLLDIPPWVPHDLRRTCRTGLARLGCPRPVAEAILGHSAGGIVGNYDLHQYESEGGEWLQRWADHLESLFNDRQPAAAAAR